MTIKDLARETGYSTGTVSRVLNGHPNVSEHARDEILRCIERSGFEVNANAKHLRQQHGKGILAVVTGSSNELFARMLEFLQRYLAGTDYALTVDYLEETGNAVAHAQRRVRELKPQGLVFLGGDQCYFTERYASIGLPGVLLTVDASALGIEQLSSVTTDDRSAAEQAVTYLIEQGHRRIALICGDLCLSTPSRLRYDGCCRALERAGLTLCQPPQTARYSLADGYAAMLRLLDREPVPTAVFAVSDVMALGALRALHDRGLRVPQDMSVVGYDGLELSEFSVPRLTTVHQNADELARTGVRLLLDTIEKHSPTQHLTVPFDLKCKDSVCSVGDSQKEL